MICSCFLSSTSTAFLDRRFPGEISSRAIQKRFLIDQISSRIVASRPSNYPSSMLSSMRGFWSRHKRRIFISLGVVGSGYLIYKYYELHRRRILQDERLIEDAKLPAQFGNTQKMADEAALHFAPDLQSRLAHELDHSYLKEMLYQGKGQLTMKEKLELWERLKVLSFTRAASWLWSMTILCLYSRVQYNILVRRMFIEIARSGTSLYLNEIDTYTKHEEEFLVTAEYLSTQGFNSFIQNMQIATKEALKDKQLKEPFNISKLRETMLQILKLFMSIGEPNYWTSYLLPENAYDYRQQMAMSVKGFDDSSNLMDATGLGELISETRAVLLSLEFGTILEMSLEKALDVLMKDLDMLAEGASSSGVPLVRLLTQLAERSIPLPKFAQAIRSLPEVDQFCRLLYSNQLCL